MAVIIGIDLGTSNSACAYLQKGRPVLIPSVDGVTIGGKAFPSYVAITKDGQLLVGEPARRQAVSNPEGTAFAFKRKMGSDYKYKLHGKEFTPQQLSAFLLQKIKNDAEAFIGEKVEKAVITVPAYFNDNQRQATKDAGTIAGLEVVRLVNEPTAACLAYGVDKSGSDQRIMVFDLGGGTLDVTLMEMSKEGAFEVVATSGDTQLGGTDMDNAVIDWILSQFRKQTGIDLRNDSTAMQRIREAAEKAKIELSTIFETEINLPFITMKDNNPLHLKLTLTRSELEKLIEPIINRCKGPVDRAIEDAKNNPRFNWKGFESVTKVILVGGPTRMPAVQRFIEDYIGIKPERGVDPMECVAFGAAIQAGVLMGEVKDIVLLDVTPLTLGVEVLGGMTEPIIERNTTIPIKKSKIFTTASDNQTAVTIHVVQGERPMAKDNTSLGMFNLEGIPPAPRGVPQIEVSFDIDASGILHVTAVDLGTKKQASIRIEAPHKLKKEEIDRMIKEAEKYAEEDKKKKELITAKNELDTLVYSVEKSMSEYGSKLSEDERAEILKAIDEAKEVLKKEDVKIEDITKAKENLSKKSHKLAEILYREAKEAKKPEEKKDGGDVIEGEKT